jgi:sulfonate transport system substrate-binding protein
MKLPRLRMTFPFLPLGLAALAALAAPVPARAGEMEETTLAFPAVNLAFIDTFLAGDEGLWKKEGLAVEVRHIQGIGATNAVIAGSVDFGFASGPTVTRANARGQKLVALATTIDSNDEYIVLRKEIAEARHFEPAASLAERGKLLKGLTIATGGAGAIPDVVLKVVAKEAGLPPDSVRTTPMQPPVFMAAFAHRSIDGFVSGPPFTQVAVLDGTGVIITDPRKGEPKDYSPVASALLLARADFCPAHHSICVKLVHGIVEASRLFHADKKEAIAVMKRHFGKYDEKVLEASYEALATMMPVPPITTARQLENSDRLSIAAGFLKPSDRLKDYEAIIDNSFAR